ncbi:FkbM family methyltransferase [Pantoea sp. S-LA4]|uniref:FkbM family methyltransferase n=1 Tax=Pantoea TaxID=53335 RepID=UPI001EEF12AD|nr:MULTISPECIES: FkbM family methyltransferase [Pantoea]UIL53708.1 FkbM family methyltransferase [Pantoea agglomerans]
MTKVSYAQNYEDIMLWRALKHIENGFYVDVGANDPIIDSVTKLFYDAGWSGINIDPVEKFIEKYHLLRERDISIAKAVSDEKGVMQLWQCDVPGWSTLDKDVAAKHESEGYEGYWSEVSINTLAAILEEQNIADIHFLKIDVEGAEYAVLKGNDWNKYRPWIVLIEATVPNTQISDYDECEKLLLNNNYHHVFSDGLNRYYVANEHPELDDAFKYPPNVFDEFISYRESQLQSELDENYIRMVKAVNEANTLYEKEQALMHELERLTLQKEETDANYQILLEENLKLSALATGADALKEQENEIKNDNSKKEKSFLKQKNKLLQKIVSTEEELEQSKAAITDLNSKIAELNRHAHHWWETAQRFETELNLVYASRTWRYGTLPKRILSRIKIKVHSLKQQTRHLLSRITNLTYRLARNVALSALQKPAIRGPLLKVVNRFPGLKSYLKRKYIRSVIQSSVQESTMPKDSVKINQIKNVIKAKLKK